MDRHISPRRLVATSAIVVEQIIVALLAILTLPGEFRAMWRARPTASASPPRSA